MYNLKDLISVSFKIILVILLLEIIIRFAAPQPLSPPLAIYDPDVGYSLIPNTSGVHTIPGLFSVTINVNSFVFRDYEYNKEIGNDTVRLIFLGDSMTFGWGVELNETFVKKLEKKLNEENKTKHYELLNFGTAGYGSINQYAQFKKYGYEYNPNFAILVYDFHDGEENLNQFLIEENNNTIFIKPENLTNSMKFKNSLHELPGYAFLSEHSHSFSILRNLLIHSLDNKKAELKSNSQTNNLTFIKTLLAQFNKELSDKKIRLIVVFLPRDPDTKQIANFLDEQNISNVDLESDFAGINTSELFYPMPDSHLTIKGHELVEKSLYTELRKLEIW